jgi:predicted NUDIX family phosphoesterase
LWVGGHIEVADKVNKNLLKDTLFREIEEELNIKSEDIKEVQALGYINDDSNEVWKFHIWVCYALLTNNTNTTLTDWELDKWEFLSIEEIKEIFENPIYDVENRSRIILDDVERYVKTI